MTKSSTSSSSKDPCSRARSTICSTTISARVTRRKITDIGACCTAQAVTGHRSLRVIHMPFLRGSTCATSDHGTHHSSMGLLTTRPQAVAVIRELMAHLYVTRAQVAHIKTGGRSSIRAAPPGGKASSQSAVATDAAISTQQNCRVTTAQRHTRIGSRCDAVSLAMRGSLCAPRRHRLRAHCP